MLKNENTASIRRSISNETRSKSNIVSIGSFDQDSMHPSLSYGRASDARSLSASQGRVLARR